MPGGFLRSIEAELAEVYSFIDAYESKRGADIAPQFFSPVRRKAKQFRYHENFMTY